MLNENEKATPILLWPFVALWRLLPYILSLSVFVVGFFLGLVIMSIGIMLSLTVVGAIVGVPLIIFGVLIIDLASMFDPNPYLLREKLRLSSTYRRRF